MPQLSVPPALRHPARVASVVAVGLSLTLAACGGSDSSSSASANTTGRQGGPGGGGFGVDLTSTQRACLKKEGVTLPTGGQRPNGQRPSGPPPTGTTPNGAPPTGTTPNGAPPNGGPPAGGQGRPGGASFQKLQAAMKKCGIDLPQRPQGAPGTT